MCLHAITPQEAQQHLTCRSCMTFRVLGFRVDLFGALGFGIEGLVVQGLRLSDPLIQCPNNQATAYSLIVVLARPLKHSSDQSTTTALSTSCNPSLIPQPHSNRSLFQRLCARCCTGTLNTIEPTLTGFGPLHFNHETRSPHHWDDQWTF